MIRRNDDDYSPVLRRQEMETTIRVYPRAEISAGSDTGPRKRGLIIYIRRDEYMMVRKGSIE